MHAKSTQGPGNLYPFVIPQEGHPGLMLGECGLLTTRDMDTLETVQQRATTMTKGLEHLLYERPRARTLQPGEHSGQEVCVWRGGGSY